MDTNITNINPHPARPSLDHDTFKTQPFNTDTARNCPTYSTSSDGASITLQRARLKTHERRYLYTEDTVTVRGWPRTDGAVLLWGWSAQWKDRSAERQTTAIRSNGRGWKESFPKETPKCDRTTYLDVDSNVKSQRRSARSVMISNALSAGRFVTITQRTTFWTF